MLSWLVRLIDDRIEQALVLERSRQQQRDVEKQIEHGRRYIRDRYGDPTPAIRQWWQEPIVSGGSPQTTTDPYRRDPKC